MGKKLQRNKAGNAAQYMTRNQAIKKLQLKLADFRRLCILKGIHPREPKKKVQGANKTYYHVKDINFLMHEPLLNKFRALKAHDRKARRAHAKKNPAAVKRLLANKPMYTLDHLVKERYPSFIDALRDLDDALTLVNLFATLPPEAKHDIPVKVVHTSQRLAMEFQAYIVRAAALRKIFISVKGYYFQAEVMGQTITWLIPHQLSPILPTDVDYRVMITFMEFYTTFVQFVNFKLYHSLGLRYPPVLDPRLEEAAEGIEAIMRDIADKEETPAIEQPATVTEMDEQTQERINTLQDKLQQIAHDEQPAADSAAAAQPMTVDQSNTAGDTPEESIHTSLFKGLIIFLSREVPREPLLFVIRSFGGVAAWDGPGSPYSANDEVITHHVVDRPTQGHIFLSRVYVQPQWAVDSANNRILMPVDLYAPGKTLPPHLSPFATNDDNDYVPDFAKVVQRLQESARSADQHLMGDVSALMDRDEADNDINAQAGSTNEGQTEEQAYLAELRKEMEAAGEDPSTVPSTEAATGKGVKRQVEAAAEDDQLMKDITMTSKSRKLYARMQRAVQGKQERTAVLESRKKKLASKGQS